MRLEGRSDHLSGLLDEDNSTEFIEAAIVAVSIADDRAAVTVVVALQGSRRGRKVDGQYLNRRMFVLETADTWCGVAWWNEARPGRKARDPIPEVDGAVHHYAPDR